MSVIKKLRVLNVTPSGDMGGRERQLLLISQSMKKDQGVQFDVLFLRGTGPFYEASLSEGIVTLKPPEGGLEAIVYCIRLMKTYDVVNFWGVNWQVFLAGIISGAILAFSLQGARGVIRKSIVKILSRKTSIKKHITESTSHGFANTNSTWPQRFNRLFKKWMLIHFLRRCSLIIVPSKYLSDFCVSYYGLRDSKLRIIKNAVNFDEIKASRSVGDIRAELGISPDIFIVGVAARYDSRKRLDRLIDAMGQLREYDKIKAVIYGGGDSTIKMNLDRKIEGYKINTKILFPGFKSDIYNYINALDVFILPSDSEGMGLAIVESVYLCRPTVVFQDGGGVHEVIKNRKTGYVVNDVKELADLILFLYSNPETSQSICQQGKRFVEENFNVDVTAKEYAREFINLVN